MEFEYPRVYAAIDLSAIEHNVAQIKDHINRQTKIIAVIKTDAYGHGAREIANILETDRQVWGFAVATAEEAHELRCAGSKKPLLVLGTVFPSQWELMLKEDVRLTVFEYGMAEELSRLAVKAGKNFHIHIKLDTGMSRIGFRADQTAAAFISEITGLPGITVEGIYTHFARSDEADKAPSREQAKRFKNVIQELEKAGLDIPVQHCANSAAVMDLPQYQFDAVRAGIILYGLLPSDEVCTDDFSLKPALSLKSVVSFVKDLLPGDEVSYGGTFRAAERMRLATVPVGYGDGYPRALSNKGYVLVNGKKAPICGRVCMDQFMVDVTGIEDVHEGSEVTLVGPDGGASITVEELSALCGRFNYEFVCCLGKRIPRVFYREGHVVGARDYFQSPVIGRF